MEGKSTAYNSAVHSTHRLILRCFFYITKNMAQILLNDVVFLAAAACCVAFLMLLVVLLERYNRLRDQMVADEAVHVPLSQSQTVPVAAVPVVPERSPQSPASTPEPANAPPAVRPESVAATGVTATTTATATVNRNAPTGAPATVGITDEHNIRAQMHELTQLLGAMNESLHHYDAERARETEKLAAAMRTMGEALAVVSQCLQSVGATGSLQSVEQKLDRVIGLLEKGRTGGA